MCGIIAGSNSPRLHAVVHFLDFLFSALLLLWAQDGIIRRLLNLLFFSFHEDNWHVFIDVVLMR